MSGNSILKDACLITERYGTDLEKLNQDDRVGLMRTSDVSFSVNIFTSLKNFKVQCSNDCIKDKQ